MALKWLRKAADQEYVDAQSAIGFCYFNGLGVKQDYTEALKWLEKAAQKGDMSAQYNLGIMYETGKGVTPDSEKALEWYRKAALQGNAGAYNNMGYMLLNNREKLPEAISYLEKALKLDPNNPSIMDSLGWGYYLSGHIDDGATLLRRAYSAKPEPIISAHLGEVLWMQGNKNEAERVWRKSLTSNPTDEKLKTVMNKFMK